MKIITKEVLIQSLKAIKDNKRLCEVLCYIVENDFWKKSCCLEDSLDETKNPINFWKSTQEENDIAYLYLSTENYSNTLSDLQDYSLKSETFYDSRYRYLCLTNLRKFPTAADNRPYGIDFMQDDRPASVVLIGANGTGKTSLYIGMEYTLTHRISAARLRKIPESNFEDFITYGSQSYENVKVQIFTMDNQIINDTPNEKLFKYQDCLPCFFCSEYDLIKMGESTPENLLKYIVSQIGFDELLKFKKYINEKRSHYKSYVEYGNTELSNFLSTRAILRKQNIIKSVNEIVLKEKFSLLFTNKEAIRPIYIHNLYLLKKCSSDISLPQLDDSIEGKNEIPSETLETYISQFRKTAILFIRTLKAFLNKYTSQYKNIADESYINSSELKNWIEEQHNQLLSILENDDLPTRVKLSSYSKFDFEEKRLILKDVIDQLLFFWESPKNQIDFKSFNKGVLDLSEANNKCMELMKEISDHNQTNEKDKLQDYGRVKDMLDDLDTFSHSLDQIYQKQLEILERLFKSYIEEILTEFAWDKDEKYTLCINKNAIDIQIRYKDAHGKEVSTNPRKYLNSFRYKLFNMSLKIAMAFSAMRLNKIIHPIIFDDVFYSSDFENRNRVEDFIIKTYEAYEKFVREGNENCPDLQLIFLSHDDIILDAIRGGMHFVKNPNGSSTNVLYGRLFDYREMNRAEDIVTRGNNNFNNLYVKL